MKKTILYSILITFVIYWICTLIYVSPKNYIKISMLEHEKILNTFFFQKWGFFAPPPNYDDRLYFTFESKKDSTQKFRLEAFELLHKRKSKKAPFNSSEDILDYLLSSTIHSITDGLFVVNQAIDYEEESLDTIVSEFNNKERIERGKVYTQGTSNFKTLKNYALLLAKKNKIEKISDFNLEIEIVQIDMPKFADRNKKVNDSITRGNLIFKSDKISL